MAEYLSSTLAFNGGYISVHSSCTIIYVGDEDRKYLELGTSDTSCLAAYAFFALSLNDYEPFYVALIDYILKILPFDIGGIELAG